MSAESAFDALEFDEAYDLYRRVLEDGPARLAAEAMKRMTEIDIRRERFLDASQTVLEILDHHPDADAVLAASLQAFYDISSAQLQAGRRDEAASVIKLLIDRDPEHIEGRLLQAKLQLLSGDTATAVAEFARLRNQQPVAARAWVGWLAARGPSDASARDKAIGRLEQMAASERRRAAVDARQLGFGFLDEKDWPRAALLGEIAMKLSPNDPYAQYLMGLALFESGEYERAVNLLKKVRESDHEKISPVADDIIAYIQSQRGRLERDKAHGRIRQLRHAADAHYHAGRYDEAIRGYEELITEAADAFPYDVLEAREKLEKARVGLTKARARDAHSRGFQAYHEKRYADAVPLFEASLAIYPGDVLVQLALAESLIYHSYALPEDHAEAAIGKVQDIQNELAAKGQSLSQTVRAASYAALGSALVRQNRLREALTAYDRAYELFPDLPELSGRRFKLRLRVHAIGWMIALALATAGGVYVRYRWPLIPGGVLAYAKYVVAGLRDDRRILYQSLITLVTVWPDESDWRRELADLAFERGDHETAFHIWKRLGTPGQLDSAVLFKYYDICVARNDMETIKQVSSELLKRSIDRAKRSRLLQDLFKIYVDEGKPDEAARAAKLSLEIEPRQKLMEWLADYYRARGEYSEALAYYRRTLEVNPAATARIAAACAAILGPLDRYDDPGVRGMAWLQVDLYRSDRKYEEAAAVLEKLLSVEKDPRAILRQLLQLYGQLGNGAKEFEAMEQLYAHVPNDLELGFRYSGALAARGRKDDAQKILKDMMVYFPNNVELVERLYKQGMAEMEGGELDTAISIFRHILGRTHLDTKDVRLMLAKCLFGKGLPDDAIAILQAVEGGGYHKLKARSLTADAFIKLDKPKLAVDILTQINFFDPNMTDDLRKEMKYLLAVAYEQSGSLQEAAELLDELILEDITYRDVKERHGRLAAVQRRKAEVITCPACQKSTPKDSKHCHSCGANIEARR